MKAVRITAPTFTAMTDTCKRKARLSTAARARDFAKRIRARHGYETKLKVYRCPCCGFWHVTTKI